MAKTLLILCISAVLIQFALGQCLGRYGAGLGRCGGCGGCDGCAGLGGRLGYGPGLIDIGLAAGLGASYGGGFTVTSGSAVPALGLGITSENVYEGCLGVSGNLPFVGSVGVEGLFPTIGAGAVNYGCGDGAVGITNEGGYGGYGLGYGDVGGYGLGYGDLGGYGLGYGDVGCYGRGYGDLGGYGVGYGGYGLGGCGCGCGGLY